MESSDRNRGRGKKLRYRRFHLNSREIFAVRMIEHWQRLSVEAVELPPLKYLLHSRLDVILEILL